MITKLEKERIISDIKKNHPDEIFTTKQLSEYTQFCAQTIKNYGYMGMPRIAKNRWYVPHCIFWIEYDLPQITERKKIHLHA